MNRRRGIAIVVVMLSLGLLAVTTLAIVYLSNRSLMQSKVLAETDEAFFAAQAALNLKVAELKGGDDAQKTGQMTDSDAHYDVKVYRQGEPVPELKASSPYIVPNEHVYIVAKGFDRDPGLPGPKPREVVLGALFQNSATVFTAAALAGVKLELLNGGYTDTYDPLTGLPGTHALAHIGVFNSNAEIKLDSGSSVGNDGSGNAVADILLPTGFVGALDAPAGTHAAQTVSPFLSAPDAVPPRTHGTAQLDTAGSVTITPTLVDGEYVLTYEKIKVQNGGLVTLDVSTVPDGETVYIDVKEFDMDGGTFEVTDSDIADYGTGSASEVDVQVYATSKFSVSNRGQFLTLNNEPRRMVAYCEQDMRLTDLATSYMIARSKTKVEVLKGSEIYGSVLSDGEVIIKDISDAGVPSKVHYDESLADEGGGATGGGTLVFVSYQRLN